MRKVILSLLIGFITVSLTAQTDQRSTSTKITDILARYPYQNAEENLAFTQQIENFSKTELTELAGRLNAPGAGDNTAAEYGIMAYTFYISGKGKKAAVKEAIEVYGKQLQNKELGDTRSFLLLQLEILGSEDAIPFLSTVINEENIGERAIRTIGRINSKEANQLLLNSLKNLKGRNLLAAIEMLGINKYTPAEKSIRKLATSSDEEIAKLAVYALASIGETASSKTLVKSAKAANYGYSNNGAAGAFAEYILNIAEKGNTAVAGKLAADYLKSAEAAGNISARIAGLNLIKEVNKGSSLPYLMRAAIDDNAEYRGAALHLAKDFNSTATHQQWLGVLANSPEEASVDILNFLAETKDPSLFNELRKYLTVENKKIKLAAIHAVGQTGGKNAVPDMVKILNSKEEDEVNAAKQELLLMKGSEILPEIRSSFSSANTNSKIALLEIISRKRDNLSSAIVFESLKSSDAELKKSAYTALAGVVEEKDLNRLYTLASNAGKEDLKYIQDALVAAVRNADKDKAAGSVKEQMQKNNPAVYFPVLTALDTRETISALKSSFTNADEQTKKSVISALGSSTQKYAADALLSILRENPNTAYKTEIATALLKLVSGSSTISSDQKILLLREIMEIASEDQKRGVIREAGRSRGLSALIFASEYLDHPRLGSDAGSAVMNIALADKNLNGEFVRKSLTKAMNGLKGLDSEYQKQAIIKHLDEMPEGEGFISLFNGKDLSGWKGLVGNPISRKKMSPQELAQAQKKADSIMHQGWKVEDGLLIFTGKGDNIATVKDYGDIEMLVDWKITKDGDAGIYLRGTPQVQIWDTARVSVGAQVGSGGLYNNQKNPSKPLVLADNAIGEWNTFRIIMKGEKVTVYLNGVLVVDNVTLENFWDRSQPIFPSEQIELQAHGTYVAYRNIFIKSLNGDGKTELSEDEKADGFSLIFDGTNLDNWQGNKEAYIVDNGTILVQPGKGSGGNLFTNKEYSDFIIRFEFQLTPGANNGLGIRAPLQGDAAYEGMEIQILDNDAPVYKDLKEYQYHGSVYGIIPAKRGFLKPTGEWNYQEVYVKGSKIKVTLNGSVILDGDIKEASKNGTADGRPHPGLDRKKGHIGFLGHGSVLRIKNIRVKEL